MINTENTNKAFLYKTVCLGLGQLASMAVHHRKKNPPNVTTKTNFIFIALFIPLTFERYVKDNFWRTKSIRHLLFRWPYENWAGKNCPADPFGYATASRLIGFLAGNFIPVSNVSKREDGYKNGAERERRNYKYWFSSRYYIWKPARIATRYEEGVGPLSTVQILNIFT